MKRIVGRVELGFSLLGVGARLLVVFVDVSPGTPASLEDRLSGAPSARNGRNEVCGGDVGMGPCCALAALLLVILVPLLVEILMVFNGGDANSIDRRCCIGPEIFLSRAVVV